MAITRKMCAAFAHAAGIVVFLVNVHSVAFGQEPPGRYEAVTKNQKQQVLETLDEIGLDTGTLAAFNLTAQQAEWIVWSGRNWYFQQEQALSSARATVGQKTGAWRVAQRNLRTGSGGGDARSVMRSAGGEVVAAKDALRRLCDSLRSTIVSHLSRSQAALWATMEANRGRHMPFALLELNGEQSEDLATASRERRADLADADGRQRRAEVSTAWRQAVASALSAENKRMINAYRDYVRSSTTNLREAIETVLPVSD